MAQVSVTIDGRKYRLACNEGEEARLESLAGLIDDKIIAVPISRIDPTFDEIKSIEDLPTIERDRIEQFFLIYKRIPSGRKEVKLNGLEGANSAIDQVKTALDTFNLRRAAVAALAAQPTLPEELELSTAPAGLITQPN